MSAAALTVAGLRLRRGAREILRNVSFDVAQGGVTALMGQSGSGKTTILRAVAALEPFDEGTIQAGAATLRGGARSSAADLRALRREVGLVFQFHSLFEHLSVLDNVTLAPVHARRVAVATARARGLELLTALGVDHRARALPRELSGGEAQRVAIARALAVDPPLLMMDEPTASLDPARRDELGTLLRDLVAQGRTILLSTHDLPFADRWCTAVIRLEEGRVTGAGGSALGAGTTPA